MSPYGKLDHSDLIFLESVDVVVLLDNDSSSDTVSLSALVSTLKSPGLFLSASVKFIFEIP